MRHPTGRIFVFGAVDQSTVNPYLLLHQGYKDRRRYSAVARAEYIHNLSTLLKGLELRAAVSINQTGYYVNAYKTTPYQYALKNYDFETGIHELNPLNSLDASRTLEKDTDPKQSNSSQSTQMSYELRGLHVAAWGNHPDKFDRSFQCSRNHVFGNELRVGRYS